MDIAIIMSIRNKFTGYKMYITVYCEVWQKRNAGQGSCPTIPIAISPNQIPEPTLANDCIHSNQV